MAAGRATTIGTSIVTAARTACVDATRRTTGVTTPLQSQVAGQLPEHAVHADPWYCSLQIRIVDRSGGTLGIEGQIVKKLRIRLCPGDQVLKLHVPSFDRILDRDCGGMVLIMMVMRLQSTSQVEEYRGCARSCRLSLEVAKFTAAC